MAGFKNTETIEQALDKGAPIGDIAEYFGLSRAEVVECARRRRIEKWKEAEIAKRREALCQQMKEEAIEANWLEIQAARRAPSRETLQSIARKLKLTHVGCITINGKDYSRLLGQATAIVRARIEIVAAIGK